MGTGSGEAGAEQGGGTCLQCIKEKAAAGDLQAQKILRYLNCLREFLACRFLTGEAGDPCDARHILPINEAALGLPPLSDCGALLEPGGRRMKTSYSGFTSRVIEDEDWES